MLPTEQLMQDHRVIERMCAVLKAAADRVDKGQAIPPDFFSKALDFIRNFADRAHHGKEEDNLFPAMEQHGLPRHGGPVGVMMEEHDQGRTYVRGMDQAIKEAASGDKSALRRAAQNARGYADLLVPHIKKEDNVLYAMADRFLSRAEQQQLAERFAAIEAERLGPEKRKAYIKLVEDLEKVFGLTRPG
jgi:hemerythrin-like domain-containing protein